VIVQFQQALFVPLGSIARQLHRRQLARTAPLESTRQTKLIGRIASIVKLENIKQIQDILFVPFVLQERISLLLDQLVALIVL
jgi:hypothetical protein